MRGARVLALLSMVLAPSLARGQTVEARVDR
jgi:hypothetical protein